VSIVAALSEVLGPIRTSPAQRGVNVTFERGGRWRTMHVVEGAHLELSIEVPELAAYRVHAHIGPATVLGEREAVEDVRWRVKSDTPALAAAIFDEPPWPRRESLFQGPAWPSARPARLTALSALKVIAGLLLGPFGFALVFTDETIGGSPMPLYVLDVQRGIASIERRDTEPDPALALGMVRRLVQVATWPDRAMAQMRELAARLGGEVEGDRWAPGANAITIRRPDATIRIDHELTSRALRTRVRVLDAEDAAAYVAGMCFDADIVGRTIDALMAKTARPSARSPYR
jgi:hypothetical protein